jgi:hypothetical protein
VHVKGGVRGAKFAEHFAVGPDEASFVFPHLSQNDMIEALKTKPVVIWTRNLGRFTTLRTNSIGAIARNVCACGESDNAPISTARNVEKTFKGGGRMFAAEPDILATC